MNFVRHTLPFATLTLALLAGAAQAAGPQDTAQQKYQQDRQACLSGNTWEDQQTCLKEAGAAMQASRRGSLTSNANARLTDNSLARCDVFKDPADQAACVARVEGPVSGSVPEGGVLRESVITTITPAAQ
ncbi:MAG: hypothetical protein ACTS5V_04345 [Giesbergeria sp.]